MAFKWWLFLMVMVSVSIVFFVHDQKESQPQFTKQSVLDDVEEIDVNKTRARMKEVLTVTDPTVAYDKFRDVIDQFPKYNDFHLLAHLAGEALYQQVGVAALNICGSEYDYGCIHQLMGEVVSEKGLRAVSELNDYCHQDFVGESRRCQHGLGHGIMAYVGDVMSALTVCDSLADSTPIYGCQGGVFMEYNSSNVRGLAEGESFKYRPLDFNNIYEPCYHVGKQHRTSCFYRLPEWWVSQLRKSDWQNVVTYCLDITNRTYQAWCVRGVGAITYFNHNHNIEGAIESCRDAFDAHNIPYCLQSVRWAYEAEDPDRKPEDAEFICDGLGDYDTFRCLDSRPDEQLS